MPNLLFVCVHNAGRSVMAEAFAKAAGADALSAGTIPQERPHPEVVVAMAELGIDVSGHAGRMLTDDLISWADRVITMGCAVDEAACPAIRFTDLEDWRLDDPKGQTPLRVRDIRDEIRKRVESLLREAREDRHQPPRFSPAVSSNIRPRPTPRAKGEES